MRLLFLLLLLLPVSAVSGAPAATVEAVRPPAWVKNQGSWIPMPPDLELNPGDHIRTGPGGRVLLRLAEGSELRLGEEASFVLLKLDPPATVDGPFTGLLRLVRGALRFTTTLLSRPHRRSLDIQVATVNAGISGTDVWAKAAPDRDIVCLIEGRIIASRANSQPAILDEPLSFYVAPKDAPPKPVSAVTPAQLKKWIAQVALEAGTGIIADGRWTVALGSYRIEERANRALEAVHAAGIPASIIVVTVEGELWRRLVVSGFSNRSEAMSFVDRTRDLMGVVGAWAYDQCQQGRDSKTAPGVCQDSLQ
ncbi:MAG: FecR domain-containing protein [Sedimenticolaceae bacterium]